MCGADRTGKPGFCLKKVIPVQATSLPKTGIVRDPRYLAHATGRNHPESARRLETIYAMLDQADFADRWVTIKPQPCTRQTLCLVHSPEYVAKIAATTDTSMTSMAADTPLSAASYLTARLAVGGLIQAVEQVLSGRLTNAMALIRPPGHHAEAGRAMGFCIFNNVAVAARYARVNLNVQRVLIVDWDVHHGNGTQHAFERDPSVLFFSIHQYPHYPGTGLFTEAGSGPGEGYTINLPLSRGYADAEFVAIFNRLLLPVAEEFGPQLVLVSAGFDIHTKDPLGAMRVTPAGFAALTRIVMDIAERCCNGRLVLTLEGGYHRGALQESVKAVIEQLTGKARCQPQHLEKQARSGKVKRIVQRCTGVHKRFWRCLS